MGKLVVRFKRWWYGAEWPVIGGLAVLTFALGVWGYAQHFAGAGVSRSIFSIPYALDLSYASLQLIVLESNIVNAPIPWTLQAARFLFPLLAAYTAIQAFAVIFLDQWQRVRIKRWKNHVVVFGLGTKGALLASNLRRAGKKVVAVERDTRNPRIDRARDEGIVVFTADATDGKAVRHLRLRKADAVVALCGNDGTNAEVALRAIDLAGDRRPPLTCWIHVVDPELCRLLRERRLAAGSGSARIEYFNVFETGAAEVWEDLPLDRIRNLLIVGLGRMGENILLHAARALASRPSSRMTVIIVDRSAAARCDALKIRYPRLTDVCDLVACDMDVSSAEFERGDFLRCAPGARLDAVCVCLDDDARGVAAALTVARHCEGAELPIVVRVREYAGLACLIDGHPASGNELRVFGLLDRSLDASLLSGGVTETLARAIHAAYVAKLIEAGERPEENISLRPWHELSDDQRESNRRQADHLTEKLRALGCSVAPMSDWTEVEFEFSPAEIHQLAVMEHNRWVEDLRAAGWKLGPPPKNPARKTHPWLLPWDELPDEAKDRNRNTALGLQAFVNKVGYRLVRRATRASATGS